MPNFSGIINPYLTAPKGCPFCNYYLSEQMEQKYSYMDFAITYD